MGRAGATRRGIAPRRMEHKREHPALRAHTFLCTDVQRVD